MVDRITAVAIAVLRKAINIVADSRNKEDALEKLEILLAHIENIAADQLIRELTS